MTLRFPNFAIVCIGLVGSALFAFPLHVAAAVEFVNVTSEADLGPTEFPLPSISHTSGNLIVVTVKWEGGPDDVTVTDTAGNTYLPLTQREHPLGDLVTQFFYAKNIIGHASNVVTIHFDEGRSFIRAAALQYSGADTASPFDQENWGSGNNGTSMSTASITTTADDEVLVAMAGEYAVQSGYTPGTNYTERVDFPVLWSAGGSAIEDRIVSSSGTYNATMDQSTSGPWIMNLASFKAAETPSHVALSKPSNNLGLVGYWSFNEGAGTVATDFSGNGNHGTLENSPAWISGKRSRALDFPASTDRVNVPATSTLRPASVTVSAWVRITDTSSSNQQVVGYAGNSGGYQIVINSPETECVTSSIGLWMRYSGGDACASYALSSFSPGEWNHVAATYDGDTTVFYLNGVSVDTDTNPTGAISYEPADSTFCIGQRSSGLTTCTQSNTNFGGSVDEVRVYSRALGPTEVAALAQAGATRVGASAADLDAGTSLESGLVGHWTMDGKDTQSTIVDRSGNGNNGGFFGGATSSAKVIGKLGQAFDFDGVDDFVDIANSSSLNLTGPLTLAAWVKRDGDCGISNIFSKESGGGYYLWCGGSEGFLHFGFDGGEDEIPGNEIGLNEWHHVTGVFDGDVLRIYIDGALDVEEGGHDGPSDNSGSTLSIGAGAGDPFPGIIDDARVYNRALTATEVQRLYNLGIVKVTQ